MLVVFGAALVLAGLYQFLNAFSLSGQIESAMHQIYFAVVVLTGFVGVASGLVLIALHTVIAELRAARPAVKGASGWLFGQRMPYVSVVVENARDIGLTNADDAVAAKPAERPEGSAVVDSGLTRTSHGSQSGNRETQQRAASVVCQVCGFGNPPGAMVCRCGKMMWSQTAEKSTESTPLRGSTLPAGPVVYCPMCGFGNPVGTAVCRCGCDLKRHG